MIAMIVVASIVVGYIITSCLLLRYPHILHQKKDVKFRCRHISHRGGAAENLENTIGAFKAAHAEGTEMFELDCQLTRDHQVVVSHDDHLRRVTGQDVYISQTDYKDLPALMSSLKVAFDPSRTVHGTDTKIALLKDVFDLFPQVPVNIDLKTGGQALIREVEQLIRDYNREEITVWGSFSEKVLQDCHRLNPRIPTFLGIRRVVCMYLAFYCGLLPFLPITGSFLEIPMPTLGTRFWETLSFKNRVLISLLDWLMMAPMLFRHLQRRGMQVYFWVLDEDTEFRRAFRLGADGVMTDHPSKLRRFLDNENTGSHDR